MIEETQPKKPFDSIKYCQDFWEGAIDAEDEIDFCIREPKQEMSQGATDANPLSTPWSLQFDRDGTEDFGIICDTEGNDLVVSHLPGTDMPRWKNREFGEGCFWLPEEEGDPMPRLVRQMRLMTAAPKLLAACKAALASMEADVEASDPQARTQIEWEAEPLRTLRMVIAEAEPA